jgi:hypothetical protein
VGQCVYCCAEAADAPLSDEHILPLALGGHLILPAASCLQCAKITGTFEQRVLRGGLRGIKERLALPSRSKQRPTTLPLFCINGDEDKAVHVAVEHYPAQIILPHFVGPQIARFPDAPSVQRTPWVFFPQPDLDTPAAKYGITKFASNSLDTHSFARMLAKIALSGAVAELGTGRFVTGLPDIILNDRGVGYLALIGSIEGAWDREDGPVSHNWRFLREEVDSVGYLTCHLRLFANFGARVIVGQLMEDFDPSRSGGKVSLLADERTASWRMMVSTETPMDAGYAPIIPDAVWKRPREQASRRIVESAPEPRLSLHKPRPFAYVSAFSPIAEV